MYFYIFIDYILQSKHRQISSFRNNYVPAPPAKPMGTIKAINGSELKNGTRTSPVISNAATYLAGQAREY